MLSFITKTAITTKIECGNVTLVGVDAGDAVFAVLLHNALDHAVVHGVRPRTGGSATDNVKSACDVVFPVTSSRGDLDFV